VWGCPDVLPVVAAMGSELRLPSTIVPLDPSMSHEACDKVVTVPAAAGTRDHATRPFAGRALDGRARALLAYLWRDQVAIGRVWRKVQVWHIARKQSPVTLA